jgi:hypothetical protein
MILGHRIRQESPEDDKGQSLLGLEPEGGSIIVLGRNTFKEVVRGVHEGYLLPLDYVPPTPPEDPQKEGEPAKEGEIQPQPQLDPILPAIPTSQYSSLPDPPSTAPEYTFTYIPSLHILGIRHTPKRIYRFLTRRYIADEICEQVVASILDQPKRELVAEDSQHGQDEEKYWPKTVAKDSEWREPIVIDSRIQPMLRWREPQPVEEIPDYRESSAPETELKVEELELTEEELARDQMIKAQAESKKEAARIFTGPNPWSRS